jgi:excisionase family DNA binding protein
MTYDETWPDKLARIRASWLTIAEIAERYGMRPQYVRYLMESRKIEVMKVDRLYRVNPESMDAFLETQHKPAEIKTG